MMSELTCFFLCYENMYIVISFKEKFARDTRDPHYRVEVLKVGTLRGPGGGFGGPQQNVE